MWPRLPNQAKDKMSKFSIGDIVTKTGGDYTYTGTVVACFTKKSGAVRLVVENQDGMLFIFNEQSLQLVSIGNR